MLRQTAISPMHRENALNNVAIRLNILIIVNRVSDSLRGQIFFFCLIYTSFTPLFFSINNLIYTLFRPFFLLLFLFTMWSTLRSNPMFFFIPFFYNLIYTSFTPFFFSFFYYLIYTSFKPHFFQSSIYIIWSTLCLHHFFLFLLLFDLHFIQVSFFFNLL